MGNFVSRAVMEEAWNKAEHSDMFKQPNIRRTNKGKNRDINPSDCRPSLNILMGLIRGRFQIY